MIKITRLWSDVDDQNNITLLSRPRVSIKADEYVKGIVAAIDALLPLTYAYVCFLPQNYDLGLEKPMKKSLFSESTSVTEDDIQKRNCLKNIDVGYIPKIYPVNFFNSRQLKNLKGDTGSIERISERLSLVAYNEGSKRCFHQI